MIAILLEDARPPISSTNRLIDWEVGASGTITILIDGRTLLHEPHVSFVELALILNDWITHGLHEGSDYSYDPVDSDEKGWIWLRWCDSGWRIGALHQEYIDVHTWTSEVLTQSLRNYVYAVDCWLTGSAHITIEAWSQD